MSEKTLLDVGPGTVTYLERDASDPEGQHRVMQFFRDNGVLAENAKIRNSHLMQGSMKRGIMDNQKIEYWFRPPSLHQFEHFLKRNPRIKDDIYSDDESARMTGARAMSLLEPQWVIFSR